MLPMRSFTESPIARVKAEMAPTTPVRGIPKTDRMYSNKKRYRANLTIVRTKFIKALSSFVERSVNFTRRNRFLIIRQPQITNQCYNYNYDFISRVIIVAKNCF